MAMDQQRRVAFCWGLVAKSGCCGHRLTPRADEPTWVTKALLVDQADAGQGAVDARVEIGTRDLLLASLSVEKPQVVLQTPVLLDEEFCFYVTPQGGDSNSDDSDSSLLTWLTPQGGDSDSDADTDTESDTNDGVAVYFGGIVYALASRDTEEDQEAVSSEDDDEKHEKESEGTEEEDDDDVVSSDDEGTASSNEDEERSKVGRRATTAANEAFSGIFAFIYLVTFLVLFMYC